MRKREGERGKGKNIQGVAVNEGRERQIKQDWEKEKRKSKIKGK